MYAMTSQLIATMKLVLTCFFGQNIQLFTGFSCSRHFSCSHHLNNQKTDLPTSSPSSSSSSSATTTTPKVTDLNKIMQAKIDVAKLDKLEGSYCAFYHSVSAKFITCLTAIAVFKLRSIITNTKFAYLDIYRGHV